MRRDHDVTGDRRSWWFWPAIVVVIAAVVALIVWTLVQTTALGEPSAIGTGLLDSITEIATTAIS